VSISMPLDSLTNKDSTKTTDTIITSQPIVSSDDWELPADFSGKDAFVPIEPEIDSP